ncbi:tonB dependent receptor family protein [Asticcacaulis biprosthecium C19]|uniref:TonB dependent receptor family protein n=1 Tax=Asticcacaulis biprosthecium C19 TaxID=715226 RepID=F4QH75_9CAUL|nr:outer membrane beta-barrel family protein [Asticcacaulis biprosthecium]EGF92612.1 tonB dependent receptor family protein [Asticcacaulis biprosthecium C19]
MNFSKSIRSTTALCGGVFLSLAAPAMAQDAPAAPPPAQTTPAQAAPAAEPAPDAQPAPESTPGSSVTITGKKPTNRIDRQTYDVKNDIDAQSGTAADTLNKVPSVNVDPEGNVTLRGNSNVQVYVDGKPSAMMKGDNRAATLQSMAGGDIDSVEVMNNPGAQFSAEGSGGIINIVMRRNRKPGNSGTIIANIGSQGRYNATFSGARNSGKMTLSGGASFRHDGRDSRSSSTQQRFNQAGAVVSERDQSGLGSNRFDNLSLNGGIDYNITDTDQVSTQLGYGKRTADSDGIDIYTGFDNSGSTPKNIDRTRNSMGENDREDTSFSVRWDHTGDSPAETLKVDLRVSTSNGNNLSTAYTDYVTGTDFEEVRTSDQRSANGTFSIDYQRNVGSGQLSLGTQTTYDDNQVVNTSQSGDPDAPADALLNNDFAYKQIVNAAYVTYQTPIGEKWTVMGGLRSETIDLKTRQITTGTTGTTSYTKLVPSAFATYTLSDNSKLRFSYSHRLRRPNPQDLNPYVIYLDPQNVMAGNPDLVPSESDSFEAGYEYNKEQTSYALRLYYRKSTNQITDVSTFISPGVLLTTKQNLGEGQQSGLEFNYNGKLWQKLTVSVNGNVGYEELETPNGGTDSGITTRGRVSLDYQVSTKDRVQLSMFTSGQQLTGQGYRSPFSRGQLSYRRQINPKLAFVATADDIFRTAKVRSVTDTATVYSESYRSMSAPTFYIGLNYILGGANPNQQNQDGQGRERWREGGGGRGNWGGGGPGGGMGPGGGF